MFCNRCLWFKIQQLSSRDIHVIALFLKLIWFVTQNLHKLRHCNTHQARMSHPTTIIAIICITGFVIANACKSALIRLRIGFAWNQSTHATHRRRTAFMACFHQQQCICAHKWCRHGHLRTIGQAEIFVIFKFFDTRENIIPTPRI